MELLTTQEYFNNAWNRAKIPVQAIGADNLCRYRKDRTAANMQPENCCFIGVSISPADYLATMEGQLLEDVLPVKAGTRLYEVLDGLQRIHDGDPPDEWENELRKLARRHGLTVPE